MKGKERDQNSKADQKQQIDVMLRIGGKLPRRDGGLQIANVETARFGRNALIKQDQSKQQNETAEREIDRDLPGGGDTVAAAPNSDQQKCRDERELVKRVKEKEIERSERADGAGGDKQEAGIKRVLIFVDLAGEPNGRQRDDRGQQNHDQTQAIDAGREIRVATREKSRTN